MEILLDTNFAISCTKQKIDFFGLVESLTEETIKWIVPREVLDEVELLSKNKDQTIKDRQAAKLFLDIFNQMDMGNIEVIELNGKIVDNSLVNFCNKNPKIVLATLDKKLKSRVKNPILTIKGKSFLSIQRDIKYK